MPQYMNLNFLKILNKQIKRPPLKMKVKQIQIRQVIFLEVFVLQFLKFWGKFITFKYIETFMDNEFSSLLCGFRRTHNA